MNNEEKLARLWAVVLLEAMYANGHDRRISISPGGPVAFEVPKFTGAQAGSLAITSPKAVTIEITNAAGNTKIASVTTAEGGVTEALDRLLEIMRRRAEVKIEEGERIAADAKRLARSMLSALGDS